MVGDGLALVRQAAALQLGRRSPGLVGGLHVGGRILARGERLGALAAVAVDGERLHALLPRQHVGAHDVLGRGLVRHVDGLADGARDEGLHGAHHLDVAAVVDAALTVGRRECAVEHRQVLLLQPRRALDGLVLVDVGHDLLDGLLVVPQLLERGRHGVVDHLQHAAADQALVLDQRDVGLDAGGVAVHHEADGARGGQHRRLRVAVAEHLAAVHGGVPLVAGGLKQVLVVHAAVGDVLRRAAVAADDAVHGLGVRLVALKGTHALGQARAHGIRAAGHERRDGRRVAAALIAVVRQPVAHEQRAQVGVAQAQLAVLAGVLADHLGGVPGARHDDVHGRDDHVHRLAEVVQLEHAVLVHELHEVERGQVAGGVVQVHVLAARVGAVDAARLGAGVPAVDGAVELHARVAAHPRGLGDVLHEVAGLHGVHHLAAGDGGGVPVGAGLHGVHELVAHAHRVVGVLELDAVPGLAVQAHVVAHLAERPGLLLLLGLAVHELGDVGVIHVEDDHLGGATRGATALDGARAGVGAAHERHRARGLAAAREALLRRADVGQVDARPRAALEDDALLADPVEDRLHGVLHRQDEAGRALRVLAHADVEPHGRVECGHLVHQQVRQLVLEHLGLVLGREVTLLHAPCLEGEHHAVDELLH